MRASLPERLRVSIDSMEKSDRSAMLRMMRDVSAASGYEAAVTAMATLADGGVPSEADVSLAASLLANGQGAVSYDDEPDLEMYDAVFAREA